MVGLLEAVYIPFVAKLLDEGRTTLYADEGLDVAADLMLHELVRWTAALQPLRQPR